MEIESMILKEGISQNLSLEGEVVGILERGGRKLTRISVLSLSLIDVGADSLKETHLGDRVKIDVQFTIERVQAE